MKQFSGKKKLGYILLTVAMFLGMGLLLFQNYSMTHKKKSANPVNFDNLNAKSISQIEVNDKVAEPAKSQAVINNDDIINAKINSILNQDIFEDSKFKALEENYGPTFKSKPSQPNVDVIR